MYLFNRSITVNVRSIDSKILSVDGVFLDSHHELCMTLEVDVESHTITSATGEFRRYPHTDCVETQQRINSLIGINLNGNVRKQVQSAVGLKDGCTHLTELTIECVKGLMQATYQLMNLTMQADEVDELIEQYLAGTCFHYQKS
ncbi:DUF2889 domain-containing protein [Desulfosporosinus sp.]|uniref:DUF2889 domain-containing protein n=1 Tax=Desulfosporosinus sp. TaxID=157907 RepID=UPI000E84BC40|nr:DUF2889 domain-containing protein [Desulfosporosinus sp.]MBC2722248.1 DUF2889 domain-containing protein [Desulfosporosinus sp.]MBC2727906.1 DUF2889 domain-containing protein [Desulfosporosinus sp.]HBV86654.1 hypothetical protein [Desulfosporosinus sp.]